MEVKIIIDNTEVTFDQERFQHLKELYIQINNAKGDNDVRNAWYDMTLEAFELLGQIVLKRQFTTDDVDKLCFLLQSNVTDAIWGLCADVDKILRTEYQLIKYY